MPDYFIIKHNFKDKIIPQYSLVKYLTCINRCCLVEDIITKKREWLMDYDIYPIKDHDRYGTWEYYKNYQDLIPENYYSIVKELEYI